MMDAATREIVRRVRVGCVGKLLTVRCGPVLPDDDAGREYLVDLLKPISLGQQPTERMTKAVELRAPWMNAAEAEAMIAHVESLPRAERWPSPKELGEELRLTNAEREKYQLWAIAPCDVTAQDLTEQKKTKAREAQRRARRRKGAQPRTEYRAKAIEAAKPWLSEGISRRTWYRRRAQAMAQVRHEHSKPLQEAVTP